MSSCRKINKIFQIKLQLFFDEAGKKTPPTLMGGLSIADAVYASSDFSNLTTQLRNNELNLHWSEVFRVF